MKEKRVIFYKNDNDIKVSDRLDNDPFDVTVLDNTAVFHFVGINVLVLLITTKHIKGPICCQLLATNAGV